MLDRQTLRIRGAAILRIAFRSGGLPALFLIPTLVAAAVPGQARAESDPRALAVAGRLEDAMGGRARFDARPYLTFRFVVERDGQAVADWLHAWDRSTGRYRLEGKRDGKAFLALFNVNDRGGQVYLDGVPVVGDTISHLLDFAYGRYINDSYWLLMPWKWRDPGVTLGYEGERMLDDEPFEVVTLSFEGVGLTPKDRYWAWVSRRDGLMKRWEFILQNEDGTPGTGEPTPFAWEAWEDVGGAVLLSRDKVKVGEGPKLAIRFPLVRMAEAADEAAFDPPPAGGEPAGRPRR